MSRTKNKTRDGKAPLPFSVVTAAIGGDTGALCAVLKHYERYIIALSTKRLYDEGGNIYLAVDEELRRELETRLITKVLMFKPKAA
jgi:hypothetical protein